MKVVVIAEQERNFLVTEKASYFIGKGVFSNTRISCDIQSQWLISKWIDISNSFSFLKNF